MNENTLGLERPPSSARASTDSPWASRVTDHYDPVARRFFNPWKDTAKGLSDLVRWWATAERRAWPDRVENAAHPAPPSAVPAGHIAVTFVGHSSMLARVGETTLLTDPHFSTHAGAFGRFGAPRVRQPGIAPGALPPLSVVFISHNHYDHLDIATVRWLEEHRSPLFVTCLGVKKLLEREGLRRVVELDWWEEIELGDTRLTVTPAQHWSNRAVFDRFATLWGGCYLAPGRGPSLYFAGDTGYAPYFADIRARLGAPDVALLPIGAYEPRWIMEDSHMNPADAVRAHVEVGARTSIGMHFGFFRLSDEGFDDPVTELAVARRAHGIADAAFRVLDVGESVVLGGRNAVAVRPTLP